MPGWDLVRWLTFALATLMFLTVLWSRGRGIDLTDESYYLLGLRPSQDRVEVVSDWQQILVTLAGRRELTAVTWRVLNLALLLLAAMALAHGVRTYLQAESAAGGLTGRRYASVALSVVAMLAYFCYLPLAISYNSLTAVILYGATGLALTVLAGARAQPGRGSRYGRIAATAGCALLLTLQFWVKAPSLVAAVALLAVAALLGMRSMHVRGLLGYAAAGGTGVIAALVLYFGAIRSPGQYFALFDTQLRLMATVTHDANSLFRRYVAEFGELGLLLAWLLPALAAMAFVGWRWAADVDDSRPTPRTRTALLVAASAVWTLFVLRRHGLADPRTSIYERSPGYIGALCVVAATWVGTVLRHVVENARRGARRVTTRQRRVIALVVLLASLPFAAAAGTDNDVIGQASFYPAGWLLAMVIAMEQTAMLPSARRFAAGALVLMLAAVGTEFVLGATVRPFRLGSTRFRQTERLDAAAPEVGSLRVAPEVRVFVDSVAAILRVNGYRRGDPLLSLYDKPGLVYLLGGRSPGTAWYFSHPKSETRNCYFIARGLPTPRPTFFLVDGTVRPQAAECLRRVGADLTTRSPIGRVPLPYAPTRAELRIYRAP